jgi:hypothetical protein
MKNIETRTAEALESINTSLAEHNRLLAEILKYLLRSE